MVIKAGRAAPPIPGAELGSGEPTAVFFYKVTCPVCQMAAPAAARFEEAYPGRIVGVGQDPPEELERFSREYGMGFPSAGDAPSYEASRAYDVATVPTLFLVGGDGAIQDVVESWDREGYNRISRELSELTAHPYADISTEDDGMPSFRPG